MNFDDIPGLSPKVHIPDISEHGCSGVYLLLQGEDVVYVGQAVDMQRRVSQHIGARDKSFDGVRFLPCEIKALLATEARYIRAFQPIYNNCRLSKFLRDSEIEPEPLKVIVKRAPRSRRKRVVVV